MSVDELEDEDGYIIVECELEDDDDEEGRADVVEEDELEPPVPKGRDRYESIRGRDRGLDEFITRHEAEVAERRAVGRKGWELSARQILEGYADSKLREDSNRELCRTCKEAHQKSPKRYPDALPYGTETGRVESMAQYDKADGSPLLDDVGEQLYVDYPELICAKGHRWYKGEGPRRDIKGPNPILFKSHLDDRARRQIQVESGTPDPALTRDRFDRPTHGNYNRSHPNGRRLSTPEQRKSSGAPFYK